jgi:Cof subfamily protein (haloacid dehalogenase superfamily)
MARTGTAKALPAAVKALALDLDGTALLPGNVFSGRTLRALKACQERGIRIIIATGRAVDAAERYRLETSACGPMVYFNGAEVVDMPSRTILSSTLLSPEVVNFCVDISRSMGVYFQIYLPGSPGSENGKGPGEILMAEKQTPEAEMYRDHTGIVPVMGDIKEAMAAPGVSGCIKSMFITEPDVQDQIRPRLVERFGGSIYVARTYRTFLEVMDAGVSKGQGLRFAMEYLGLKAEEIVAIGDEENDLPMFAVAGFTAAPANAKEAVREAADLVIGANTEDGVAAFLEEYILN